MKSRDEILKAQQDRIANINDSFEKGGKGLWHNIRANRGSGKEPTPEMLKQAEKIKKETTKKAIDPNVDMDEFAEKRGDGAGKIAESAKEKGGLSLLTYDHFKVKLPYYEKAAKGEFDKEVNHKEYAELLTELHTKTMKGMYISQKDFQEIMGKIEVLGELCIREDGESIEKGIPDRYKEMGFAKIGQKKNSTRDGKKWMVLAKKGDKYKVVHGGDDNMKDFSQHSDDDRRENFWSRHGGKTGKHATDPFSPLYWHKKFKTW